MTWSVWLVPLACFLTSSEGSFESCEFMLENRLPFTLACEAKYSTELKLSYRDIWVEANTNYWLWWRRDPTLQLLISFFESPISPCTNVSLSLNCLHCSNSQEPGIHILPESIHCFGFSFSYVQELMKQCGISPATKLDHVAIHYARRVPSREIPSRATRTTAWTAVLRNLCRSGRW
ncbi:uncharacterized protein LOC108088811 [Drosophila ficusphila]|uniref:uncharacterized protein LOC108088811 n=1 Tax=Drosophila ficusphila TaxID=30025 RepID=UPI0007E74E43|nr:uncharacterized protein LOC108088811 [Drosophila ficusphila]